VWCVYSNLFIYLLLFYFSIEHILKLAGKRTVPIEIGSKYTDDSWSQKLMTIEEFIYKFILIDTNVVDSDSVTSMNAAAPRGYLAQHPLFEQVC
jgi:[protein]-arginine 3-hydroxylase / protease